MKPASTSLKLSLTLLCEHQCCLKDKDKLQKGDLDCKF